jgi:hypothetical protein
MKRFIAGTICLFAALTVLALSYETQRITIGNTATSYLTNNVPAATTNSSQAVVISCQKFKKIEISTQIKLAGAGTTPVNYLYVGTVDGTNYATSSTGSFTVTPTGTITVQGLSSIDVTGLKAIKITDIQNPSANILTNLQMDVGYKDADN